MKKDKLKHKYTACDVGHPSDDCEACVYKISMKNKQDGAETIKAFGKFLLLAKKSGYTIDDAITFWGIFELIKTDITEEEINKLFK